MLPGILAAAHICLWRCGAVSRRKLDFESDDLVPYRIAAVTFWDSEEFAQAAARIVWLGDDGLRLLPLHVNVRDLDWVFCDGLFFVHRRIILRTPLTG